MMQLIQLVDTICKQICARAIQRKDTEVQTKNNSIWAPGHVWIYCNCMC